MALSFAELTDRLIIHRINIERYGAGILKKVARLLTAGRKDLATELLAGNLSESSRARLQSVLEQVTAMRAETYASMSGVLVNDLIDLSSYEPEFAAAMYASVVPDYEWAVPSSSLLKGIVTTDPLGGKHIADWVAGLSTAEAQRIAQQIKLGMVEGEENRDIVERIIGGPGQAGVVDWSVNRATTLVRTAVADVTSRSHKAYLEENSDVLPQFLWISTLDERTCEECADLSGQVFDVNEEEVPPHHLNCRCHIVGVPEGAPTEGYADYDYDTFLENIGDERAEEILGPGRFELWKDGMSIHSFVDDEGRSLTLEELRAADAPLIELEGVTEPEAVLPVEPEWTTPPDTPEASVIDFDAQLDAVPYETRDAISDAIQADLDERDIWVRRQPRGFEGILDSGRFKSAYETLSGIGSGVPGEAGKAWQAWFDRRTNAELWNFGLPADFEPTLRPIYGYATPAANGIPNTDVAEVADILDSYGQIAVKLKDSVKDRAAFSYGDSVLEDVLPMRAETADYHAATVDTIKAIAGAGKAGQYGYGIGPVELGQENTTGMVETQIFGGVTRDDIDEVVFYRADDYNQFHARLDELGIKNELLKRYEDLSGR